MNFGYLIIVSSSDNCDYLKMAYALALSIKNTQPEQYADVALVIDDKTKIDSLSSPWVFDQIIEWNQESFWDGRSWMDKLTPWENTVCLDADMLFLNDISHQIQYFLKNTKLYVANKAFTYRNEIVNEDNYYRKTFIKNNLPNLYSYFTFFRKGAEIVDRFFSLNRYIIKNPNEFSREFLSNHIPKVLGTDEAFALSAKILGIEDEISFELPFPRAVHMKPMIQNWPWPADKVTDRVGFYLGTDGRLKLGNYQQSGIVHYVEKDLMTTEYISILEDILWKKSKISTNG
jgi:hypothetical protein